MRNRNGELGRWVYMRWLSYPIECWLLRASLLSAVSTVFMCLVCYLAYVGVLYLVDDSNWKVGAVWDRQPKPQPLNHVCKS